MSEPNSKVTPIPQSEVTRVKALGFLWDKRTPDRFNGRVITRNGKITAEECRVISEAAQRFGSGEVARAYRLKISSLCGSSSVSRPVLRPEEPARRSALWSPVRAPPVSTA